MSLNDVEHLQSFCRRWFNKAVKKHFRDIEDDDLLEAANASARRNIKYLCLHKDNDTLTLTIARLLVWWFEAKGLFEEYIYGVPSTDFVIDNTYYPQVQLHFSESKYDAANANRLPATARVSYRWRDDNYSETNIRALANKIKLKFATGTPFYFNKGRELYTYHDDKLGYRFQVLATSDLEAKKVMEEVHRLQDDIEPDWEAHFRTHNDEKSYTTTKTVKVMGETKKAPKRRPLAKVHFAYALLYIPDVKDPITLCDRTGTKPHALTIA